MKRRLEFIKAEYSWEKSGEGEVQALSFIFFLFTVEAGCLKGKGWGKEM